MTRPDGACIHTYVPGWSGTDGLRLVCSQTLQSLHIGNPVPAIGLLVWTVPPRDANEEGQVAVRLGHENLDLGAAVQGPSRREVAVGAVLLQAHVVDDSTVGRLILDHEHAILVEEDAEVYVAQPPLGIV